MNRLNRSAAKTFRPSLWLVMVGVVALAGVGWYVFTGTVHYSLYHLQRAIQQGDRYLFERHVDLDHLTRRVMDDLLELSSQEVQSQALGTWEEFGAQLGIAFAQLLKPRFVDEARQAVLRAVESGAILRGAITPAAASAGDEVGHAMVKFAESFPNLKPLGQPKIHREGSHRIVEIAVSPGREMPAQTLHVRFIRTPERYWRATELANLKELLFALHELEKKRLDLANEPIHQRIRQALRLDKVTKEQGLDVWGTSADAILVVTFTNISSKPIQGLTATATIRYTSSGVKLHEAQFRDLDQILPGETKEKVWGLGLDVSDEADRQLYAVDPSRLAVQVEVTALLFEDGTSLKLATSLKDATDLHSESRQLANSL